MRLALAAAWALLACTVASAATYWVAPDGLDTNAGTEAAPFATIPVALKSLQPGDALLLKAGTYPGGISINLRGTREQPITIKAAGDGPVIIEGRAEAIPGWAPVPGHPGVYVTTDAGPLVGMGLDMLDRPWMGDDLNPQSSVAALAKAYAGFHYDRAQQRLYVRHGGGAALEGHTVWAFRDGAGVGLSGEHLRLEGLTIRRFAAQGIIVSSARNVTISRCTISHCGAVWSAGVQLAKTADVSIENCLLYHLRNGVIAQDADRTRLVHNTIFHTRAHGVYLVSGQDTVLRDNILYAGGKSGSALYLDHRAAAGLQADYSCYLDTGTPGLIAWMPLNLHFPTFWDYRETIRGQDQHSFSADPLFVSTTPGREDFHLQPGSPCRGKASDGGDVGVIFGA